MYVTFTKAEKHRVLSYKEIFYLHCYFTLNIAIFAYFILYVIVMVTYADVYNECY